MSTTADLAVAAVLFGPGLAAAVPVLLSQRGACTDSAAVQQVLAESAAERATTGNGQAPPDGGEGAPAPTTDPAVRLATVLPFRTRAAA